VVVVVMVVVVVGSIFLKDRAGRSNFQQETIHDFSIHTIDENII
jgi:hypothetical protein